MVKVKTSLNDLVWHVETGTVCSVCHCDFSKNLVVIILNPAPVIAVEQEAEKLPCNEPVSLSEGDFSSCEIHMLLFCDPFNNSIQLNMATKTTDEKKLQGRKLQFEWPKKINK